ncbi:hypothetical protein AB5I41_02540 [Sphingomonas sp. MMS24-JH45]
MVDSNASMKAVLPALARPLIGPQLPDDLEVAWFSSPAEAKAGIAGAEIAWSTCSRPRAGGGDDPRGGAGAEVGVDDLRRGLTPSRSTTCNGAARC